MTPRLLCFQQPGRDYQNTSQEMTLRTDLTGSRVEQLWARTAWDKAQLYWLWDSHKSTSRCLSFLTCDLKISLCDYKLEKVCKLLSKAHSI